MFIIYELPEIIIIIIITITVIINTSSSIDSLILDLTKDDKEELKTSQRLEVKKPHTEGVRMNSTALRREMHIKNKDVISIRSHDLEDQRDEMELVSENFESVLSLMKPLDTNNKYKNIPNDVESKGIIIRFDKNMIYHFYVYN